VNNTATGFSFSAGGIITMPNAQNRKPDFMVAVWTNVDGAVLGTFFGASAQEVFRLMGHFNTLDSAQTFFQNLIDVPGGSYDFVALPVEKNQVWIVKTREGRYGKILIRNTLAYNDTSHLPLHNSYAEATFDWIYQPNGTSRF
jgi:hypothetical protein